MGGRGEVGSISQITIGSMANHRQSCKTLHQAFGDCSVSPGM